MEKICISPLDDRYLKYTKSIKNYFSEFAFFRYRILVEIEYFITLLELNLKGYDRLNDDIICSIKNIFFDFCFDDYIKIKNIEKKIKHDVKSIEYFLIEKFTNIGIKSYTPLIHFGLTSQDVNNTAIGISLKTFIFDKYIFHFNNIVDNLLENKINEWEGIVMLSRTHGQPAVPTTLSKEFRVFCYRLHLQYEILLDTKFYGKFGGASGNLNAHKIAYPSIDWIEFGNVFIQRFGLIRSKFTTQIDNYDNIAVLFDCLKRINNILIDMCQDIWLYISFDYLKQLIVPGEVGSSTMPHKINPINFENAEGNLKLANSLLEFFSRKLPISRLQRDLTDSTVLRNLGVIFGHIFVAFNNIEIGLSKLDVNREKIQEDLDDNYVVIAEGIQTILRKYGHLDAYEKMKALTRSNSKITKTDIDLFINNLIVNDEIKDELRNLNVKTYI